MPATGSIPMATRWSSSSLLARALVAMSLVACVHSTSSFYVPTAGEARLDENDVRVEADRLLSVECDRLRAGKSSTSGEGTYVLDFAANGDVTRSRLSKSTRDKELDDIFGALSAKMHVEPAEQKAGSLRMRASYYCEPDKAVTTIEMF
jgi:hypothetical protein